MRLSKQTWILRERGGKKTEIYGDERIETVRTHPRIKGKQKLGDAELTRYCIKAQELINEVYIHTYTHTHPQFERWLSDSASQCSGLGEIGGLKKD